MCHLQRLGKQLLAGCREDGQQLLEGLEGPTQLEVHAHPGEVADVGDPGGVVVPVEPGPGDAPVVVVVQVPLDGPDVALRLLAQHRGVDLKRMYQGHLYVCIGLFE